MMTNEELTALAEVIRDRFDRAKELPGGKEIWLQTPQADGLLTALTELVALRNTSRELLNRMLKIGLPDETICWVRCSPTKDGCICGARLKRQKILVLRRDIANVLCKPPLSAKESVR